MVILEFPWSAVVLRLIKSLLLASLFPIFIFAQEINEQAIEWISEKQGLPTKSVNDLIQDNEGYIWVASDDGLTRHDGYSFQTFRHNPKDSTSISSPVVVQLWQDASGKIWYAGLSGTVGYFNPSKRSFENFSTISSGLPQGRIYKAFVDQQGIVWIGFWRHGLYYYSDRKGTFIHAGNLSEIHSDYKVDTSRYINFNTINDIDQDASGTLWLATNDGLYTFDKANKAFKAHREHPIADITRKRDDLFLCLEPDDDGLWLGSYKSGLWFYNKGLAKWEVFKAGSEKRNTIRDIKRRNKRQLWIATDNGWGTFDIPTHSFSFAPLPVPSVLCKKIMLDRTGVKWIATASGIFKYADRMIPAFVKVNIEPGHNEDGFGTSGFYNDIKNQKLYFGTIYGDGLHVRDERANKETVLRVPFSANSQFSEIHTIQNGGEDTLWVVTQNDIYICYKKQQKIVKFFDGFDEKAKTVAGEFFITLRRSSNGDIWIGSLRGGLYRYDRTNRIFERHFPNDSFFGIEEDNYGRMWLLSSRGVVLFSYADLSFTNIPVVLDDSIQVSPQVLEAITKAPNGDIWIGTAKGLIQYKSQTREVNFRNWTVNEGLPSNVIYALTCDSRGVIWGTSPATLFSLDPETASVQSFPVSSIHGNMDLYCDEQNTIYLEAYGGYFTFNPYDERTLAVAPNITVTSIKVLDKEIPFVIDSSRQVTINLEHDHNLISIEYAALHYNDPSRNRYSFRMLGLSDTWIDAGDRRQVSFGNLDPKHYTFEVKAISSEGIWTDEPVKINIFIEPPFWATWYFKILLAAIFVMLAATVHRVRMSRIAALEKIREKISRDIHDEMGSNLSAIGILSNVVKGQLDTGQQSDSSKLKEMLYKISELSSEVMLSAEEIVWSIDPQHDSFDKIILRMRSIGVQLLENQNVKFEFIVEGNPSNCFLNLERRNDFYLFYKEALNNAAKHSKCKRVHTKLVIAPKGICLSISDDGTGFDPNLVIRGNGLKNLKKRADNLKAVFKFHSVIGKGTEISLAFHQ